MSKKYYYTKEDIEQELKNIEDFLKVTDASLEEENAALRAALLALRVARPHDDNWEDVQKQVREALGEK